jgi:predicted RNA-binding protein YlxR (DUF448 family)
MNTKHVHIVPTPISKCCMCGVEDELRPYGKNGAWVCFDCMMKDEEEAKRQFDKQFLSKSGVIVIGMPAKKVEEASGEDNAKPKD